MDVDGVNCRKPWERKTTQPTLPGMQKNSSSILQEDLNLSDGEDAITPYLVFHKNNLTETLKTPRIKNYNPQGMSLLRKTLEEGKIIGGTSVVNITEEEILKSQQNTVEIENEYVQMEESKKQEEDSVKRKHDAIDSDDDTFTDRQVLDKKTKKPKKKSTVEKLEKSEEVDCVEDHIEDKTDERRKAAIEIPPQHHPPKGIQLKMFKCTYVYVKGEKKGKVCENQTNDAKFCVSHKPKSCEGPKSKDIVKTLCEKVDTQEKCIKDLQFELHEMQLKYEHLQNKLEELQTNLNRQINPIKKLHKLDRQEEYILYDYNNNGDAILKSNKETICVALPKSMTKPEVTDKMKLQWNDDLKKFDWKKQ